MNAIIHKTYYYFLIRKYNLKRNDKDRLYWSGTKYLSYSSIDYYYINPGIDIDVFVLKYSII
jgi:hypothetical protein